MLDLFTPLPGSCEILLVMFRLKWCRFGILFVDLIKKGLHEASIEELKHKHGGSLFFQIAQQPWYFIIIIIILFYFSIF
jgi:hypothetical protein